MLKKLTTVFALVATVAATSMATDTRTLTLGDNHEVLVDDANIYLFPSRVSQFPNIAVAEVGNYFYEGEFNRSTGGFSSELGRLSINWKFGTENPWVLSTNFFTNTIDPMFGGGTSVFNLANFDEIDGYPNRRIQLIYGRKLGNMNFGFGLGYTASSYQEEQAPLTDESASQIGVSVGLSDAAYKWDLAAHFRMTGFKQEVNGVTEFEADGGTEFGAIFRYFHSANPQWTVVPVVALNFGSLGVDFPDAVTPANAFNEKYTATSFMAGCGIHYMPSNNVLAIIQPGVMMTSFKSEFVSGTNPAEEFTETFTALPYFKAGVEGDVFPWLDARFGATSYWTGEKEEFVEPGDPNEVYKYGYADNQTYLGFGFNFGRLHVDTYTDPSLFLNGFNFISGRTSNMNFSLSALMELF